MPKNTTLEINDRRTQISQHIINGLKPYQIKTKFPNVDIQTIYNDIKIIKRISVKSMAKLSKDGLAFNYDNMIQQIDLIYSETRDKLLNDKEITIDEFIKLNKLARETITEKRELLKESLSIFEIDKLKQDVKELKESQQGTNTKSLMTLDLPKQLNNIELTK